MIDKSTIVIQCGLLISLIINFSITGVIPFFEPRISGFQSFTLVSTVFMQSHRPFLSILNLIISSLKSQANLGYQKTPISRRFLIRYYPLFCSVQFLVFPRCQLVLGSSKPLNAQLRHLKSTQ